MKDAFLDSLTNEELADLKQTILRWIDRRGSASSAPEDVGANVGALQDLYDYLAEIERRLAASKAP